MSHQCDYDQIIINSVFRPRDLRGYKSHGDGDVSQGDGKDVKSDQVLASIIVQRRHQIATHALQESRRH